jgi:hypothetical protein
MAYRFTNVRNMAGGLEAWSGELQASNVPPLTVEASAINDGVPEPYDVRIDGMHATVRMRPVSISAYECFKEIRKEMMYGL